MIPDNLKKSLKPNDCCIGYDIDWDIKPTGELFCSTKDKTEQCIINKKIIQATIYRNCIVTQFDFFKEMHKLSKGNFASIDIEITKRIKLVNFLIDIMELDIHKYINENIVLANEFKVLKTVSLKYIEELLKGFNEEMKKEYSQGIRVNNTYKEDFANVDDLFMNINSKTNTTNILKSFDITKVTFDNKFINSNMQQSFTKMEKMKRSLIETIKKLKFHFEDTPTIMKNITFNKAKTYYESQEFNNILESTLIHIKNSLNKIKLTQIAQQKLVSIIMTHTKLFKKIIQYNITFNSDFFKKLESGSIEEIVNSLENSIKEYVFHIKISKNPNNQFVCDKNTTNYTFNSLRPKMKSEFIHNQISVKDDGSEYNHDWDLFNVDCKGNNTLNITESRSFQNNFNVPVYNDKKVCTPVPVKPQPEPEPLPPIEQPQPQPQPQTEAQPVPQPQPQPEPQPLPPVEQPNPQPDPVYTTLPITGEKVNEDVDRDLNWVQGSFFEKTNSKLKKKSNLKTKSFYTPSNQLGNYVKNQNNLRKSSSINQPIKQEIQEVKWK